MGISTFMCCRHAWLPLPQTKLTCIIVPNMLCCRQAMTTVPSSLRDYRSTAAERVPRTTAEAGLPRVGVEGLVTKEPAVCAQQFYTKVCLW